jgi:outer membrane lipoprotein-sorting protein
MRVIAAVIVIALVLITGAVRADQFDLIKKDIANADCCWFRFISILSSSVFETKDSSRGTALIARDGRYAISLGNDSYISDGKYAYTYSPTSNQAIISRLDSGRVANKEISFLTRLDQYYTTKCIKSDKRYYLMKKTGVDVQNIPDSMVITVDAVRKQIAAIDYYDINDEQVSVVLLEQNVTRGCNDSLFVPNFPDSAETVKL